MKNIHHFVNGSIFEGRSKKTSDVYNPATGEVIGKVTLASKDDVNNVVDIAHKAFESWSNTPPLQRARILFKFKELIEKNSDELTKIIVSEHGKVYNDAKGSFNWYSIRSNLASTWWESLCSVYSDGGGLWV